MASSSWFSPSVMRMMTRESPLPLEKDISASDSALPIDVPCTEAIEGEIRLAKALAMR